MKIMNEKRILFISKLGFLRAYFVSLCNRMSRQIHSSFAFENKNVSLKRRRFLDFRERKRFLKRKNLPTGWFPAKFVEMLDERSKEYSRAGDDAITTAITDLVRGTLCPTIKAILLHGMKPTSILGK